MPGEARSIRDQLLDGAREELAAVGQAEFSMEAVAKRSYYSVGSVYRQWPERDSLLLDLITERITPDIDSALLQFTQPAQCIRWLFDAGRPQLLLVGEALLAGHGNDCLAAAARRLWADLLDDLTRILPPSMAWYLATYAIGHALLDVIGVRGPDPARGRVAWLTAACAVEARLPDRPREPVAEREFAALMVPSLARTDETTLALIDAARSLLAEHGVRGTTTRSISSAAGVTTGAVYRRYEAKSRLFADVLLTELSPERYTWTWDLISAFASSDPYRAAADVMTTQLVERSQDLVSQRVLLQIGIAARNDPALRTEVQHRIEAAHTSRSEMFAHFIEAGIMRNDVDPGVYAWGFQALPVGVRALVPLGIGLDSSIVAASMTSVISAAAE